MKALSIETKNKIEELLICLDSTIEHIQLNLKRLNEIRSFVIKRDYSSLNDLLDDVRQESSQSNERKAQRDRIRKTLADMFGCKIGEMTLSRLEKAADGDINVRIRQHRLKLKQLALHLKKEYGSTAILLLECSKINRMLLKAMFNDEDSNTVVYDASGSAASNPIEHYVNMKL